MDNVMNGERYYTIQEAAIKLRRTTKTVWRWTVDGLIGYHQVRPGCMVLIPESEVNNFRHGQPLSECPQMSKDVQGCPQTGLGGLTGGQKPVNVGADKARKRKVKKKRRTKTEATE